MEFLERGLLVLLFLGIVLLAFLQVILREFFSTGILWADVFLRHIVMWVGFLGAALAVKPSKHFVIDIVRKYLPQKAKRFIEIVTALFSLAVLAFLTAAAYKFLKQDIESRAILFAVGTFEVPAFWLNLIFPLGFLLLFIHFAAALISPEGEGKQSKHAI